MEHTTSEALKPGTRFALNCEPARLIESPDIECRPDNGAGPDPAADEDTLSVESEEESDEKPDKELEEQSDQELDSESDRESDEESDEQLEERRARLTARSILALRERNAAGVLGARGAKLAFTLPREVVDHIVDLFDGCYYNRTNNLGRWSLVCLDWARRCRGLLHKEAKIRSRESALRFRVLVKGPCSDRLTPLLDLIEKLDVYTTQKTDAWSWHHLLTTIAPAVPADKFGDLWIDGYPKDLSRFGSLIHWGVPAAVSALPAPYCLLWLEGLHFASVQSLLRLIRSLPRVKELVFTDLTWDEDGTRAPVGNVPPDNVPPGRQPRSTLTGAEFRYCQDATPLLLHTLSPGCTPLLSRPVPGRDT